MNTHTYRTVDVPVSGGNQRVGVWDPTGAALEGDMPTVLAIHGVTSSHLAWTFVAHQLPGVRIIAPDLRGRGMSNTLTGPAGMASHARDLVAVLDHFELDSLPVIGHSMGGFVAVTLAHRAPERVDRLLLVDGGLPLDAPVGVPAEQLVDAILGATAERLSRRFATVEDYFDFWRQHPAFRDCWVPELEEYFRYDLVRDGDAYRPATSLEVTTEDTVDLHTGTTLAEALDALSTFGKPIQLVTVPRGLQNETPGLYPPAHLARLLEQYPCVEHEFFDGLNHYTVVMSTAGAERLVPLVLAATAPTSLRARVD